MFIHHHLPHHHPIVVTLLCMSPLLNYNIQLQATPNMSCPFLVFCFILVCETKTKVGGKTRKRRKEKRRTKIKVEEADKKGRKKSKEEGAYILLFIYFSNFSMFSNSRKRCNFFGFLPPPAPLFFEGDCFWFFLYFFKNKSRRRNLIFVSTFPIF